MIKVIHSPTHLRGILRVPGDRSITVRAVLLGSIAEGVSVVRDYLDCDDTRAAMNIMRALGVQIDESNSTHSALCIGGVGLRGLRASQEPLFCDSSGTTMRLLAGLMAGQSFASVVDGSAQLRKRPMRRITEPLTQMGALIRSTDDCAPLHIQPGHLHGIDYVMPVASAQVKSALLLAALYANGEVIIHEAAPTRDHTERMLAAMGADVSFGAQVQAGAPPRSKIGNLKSQIELHPLDVTIPADFSSAAFFLVAGLVHPRSRLELPAVGLNPTRTGLLEALRAMGANIHVHNSNLQGWRAGGRCVAGARRVTCH